MPLNEKHNSTVKLVSSVFEKAGYHVEFDALIGPPEKQRYADIVAIKPSEAVIVEVKVGTKTGSSDVLAMESYVRSAAVSSPLLEGKKIDGVIVSPGTLDPAKSISKEFGITIIEGVSPQKIRYDLDQFIKKR